MGSSSGPSTPLSLFHSPKISASEYWKFIWRKIFFSYLCSINQAKNTRSCYDEEDKYHKDDVLNSINKHKLRSTSLKGSFKQNKIDSWWVVHIFWANFWANRTEECERCPNDSCDTNVFLTVNSRHLLSIQAPQQPTKPITRTVAPAAMHKPAALSAPYEAGARFM